MLVQCTIRCKTPSDDAATLRSGVCSGFAVFVRALRSLGLLRLA